jgi:hypothetical protein
MTSKLELDPRLDPRIKAFFAGMNTGTPQPSVSSREEWLAQESTPEAVAAYARQVAAFDRMDREKVAPSAGLVVRTETFTSAPMETPLKSNTSVGTTKRPCLASTTPTAAAWRSVPRTRVIIRLGAA